MTEKKDLVTAKYHHNWGEYYYGLAADMEDEKAPQTKIDASWRMAAMEFWQALTLGHMKAPLSLFKCFKQGLGVNKDDDIAALMYGAALQFTPQDCANIPGSSIPIISKSMKPRIETLVTLVKQTHKEVADKEVELGVVLDQMDKFNHAIKLPRNKLIQSCFTENITQTNSKKKDLKSKTLELTKNLVSQNKTLITTNHMSKKSNRVLYRTGCSIS